MGLFDFLKPKMPNGISPNSINQATGMTFYQQSMTVLGHCLILIGQIDRRIDSLILNKASQIQLLFSIDVMQMKMKPSDVKDILFDMKSNLEEMPEGEFMYYTCDGLTEMSIGLPFEVRKEILVYLMMFHFIVDKSSRDQLEGLEHIHNMLFERFEEQDPNEVMRIAMRNINTNGLSN